MTTGRINQVSYCCNYLLQPISRKRPFESVYINNRADKTRCLHLAVYQSLVLDIFPQTQLKTYILRMLQVNLCC